MHPELAKVGIQFLFRVDLKGDEAVAMAQVLTALNALANPPPVAQQAEQPAPAILQSAGDA